MNDKDTPSIVPSNVFNIGTSKIMKPSFYLRLYKAKSKNSCSETSTLLNIHIGDPVLQQLWYDINSPYTEWKDVPVVEE